MPFFEFIHACERSDNVHITQAFCLTPDEILAEYCKYPYRNDTPKLFRATMEVFASLIVRRPRNEAAPFLFSQLLTTPVSGNDRILGRGTEGTFL